MKKLRVGLIGAGGIASGVHAKGWQALSDSVDIVGVADISESAAQKLAASHGAERVFTDYRDLLALGVDAVDVCTPNRVHTPAVLASIASGAHVLCEKPLAVTSAEIRQMGEAADAAGRLLMTAQHMRFQTSSRAIKGWVDAGKLGPVYHARVHATRRALLPARIGFIDRNLSGGGPCMDIGVHALDIALWLMGHPKPVRVTGTTKTNFAKGYRIPGMWGEWDRELFNVEDFASGFVHFDSGATLVLETSWLAHQQEKEDFSCQLWGMEGGVKWPTRETATVEGGAFVDGTLNHPEEGSAPPPHTAEIAAFVDAIRAGKPSPVPWTQSILVCAILEAIYRSQEERREVQISELLAPDRSTVAEPTGLSA